MLVAFASTVLVLLVAILINEIAAQQAESRGLSGRLSRKIEGGVPVAGDDPSLGSPRTMEERIRADASIAASKRLNAISKRMDGVGDGGDSSKSSASAGRYDSTSKPKVEDDGGAFRIEGNAIKRVGGESASNQGPERDRTSMLDTVRPIGNAQPQRPGRYPSGLPDPYADVSQQVSRPGAGGGVRKIGANDYQQQMAGMAQAVPVQPAGNPQQQTYGNPQQQHYPQGNYPHGAHQQGNQNASPVPVQPAGYQGTGGSTSPVPVQPQGYQQMADPASPVPVQPAGWQQQAPGYPNQHSAHPVPVQPHAQPNPYYAQQPRYDRYEEPQSYGQQRHAARQPEYVQQRFEEHGPSPVVFNDPLIESHSYDSQQAPVRRKRRQPRREQPQELYADSPIIVDTPVLIQRESARLDQLVGEQSSARFERSSRRESMREAQAASVRTQALSRRHPSVVRDAVDVGGMSQRISQRTASTSGGSGLSALLAAREQSAKSAQAAGDSARSSKLSAKNETLQSGSIREASASSALREASEEDKPAARPVLQESGDDYDLSRANPGDLAGISGLHRAMSSRRVSVRFDDVPMLEPEGESTRMPASAEQLVAFDPEAMDHAPNESENITLDAPVEPEAEPVVSAQSSSLLRLPKRGLSERMAMQLERSELAPEAPTEARDQLVLSESDADQSVCEAESVDQPEDYAREAVVISDFYAPVNLNDQPQLVPHDEDQAPNSLASTQPEDEAMRQQSVHHSAVQPEISERPDADAPNNDEKRALSDSFVSVTPPPSIDCSGRFRLADPDEEALARASSRRARLRNHLPLNDEANDEAEEEAPSQEVFSDQMIVERAPHADYAQESQADDEEQESFADERADWVDATDNAAIYDDQIVLRDDSMVIYSDDRVQREQIDQGDQSEAEPDQELRAKRPLRAYLVSGHHRAANNDLANEDSESTEDAPTPSPEETTMLDSHSKFPAPKPVSTSPKGASKQPSKRDSIFRSAFPRTNSVEIPSSRFSHADQGQPMEDGNVESAQSSELVDDSSIRISEADSLRIVDSPVILRDSPIDNDYRHAS